MEFLPLCHESVQISVLLIFYALDSKIELVWIVLKNRQIHFLKGA